MLSGAAFDGSCSTINDCDDDYNDCSSGKCVCISTAYRNTGNSACVPSRYHNRITKTEWVNEPSLNIHLQRPKCCSTPVLLP